MEITLHDQTDNKVSVVLAREGSGNEVNKAFSNLLGEIVGDKMFEGFLREKEFHKAILNKIIYREFELEKLKFCEKYERVATAFDEMIFGLPSSFVDYKYKAVTRNSDDLIISLPSSFVKYYGDKIRAGVRRMEGVEFEDDVLYIKYGYVERRLFQPTIDGIVECTFTAFEELEEKVDTIYLVGEFGGCQYIYKTLEEAIRRYYYLLYDRIIFLKYSRIAIATGAVMWCQNPDVIKPFKDDRTYSSSS